MTKVSYDYHLNESIGGAIAAADIFWIEIETKDFFFLKKASRKRLWQWPEAIGTDLSLVYRKEFIRSGRFSPFSVGRPDIQNWISDIGPQPEERFPGLKDGTPAHWLS